MTRGLVPGQPGRDDVVLGELFQGLAQLLAQGVLIAALALDGDYAPAGGARSQGVPSVPMRAPTLCATISGRCIRRRSSCGVAGSFDTGKRRAEENSPTGRSQCDGTRWPVPRVSNPRDHSVPAGVAFIRPVDGPRTENRLKSLGLSTPSGLVQPMHFQAGNTPQKEGTPP